MESFLQRLARWTDRSRLARTADCTAPNRGVTARKRPIHGGLAQFLQSQYCCAARRYQRRASVEHTLTVLLRRDPSRDRQENRIAFEGYEMLWPDGRPISVGFAAFCRRGQRLLGLGRYLAGCSERVVDLVCIPLADRQAPFNRLPGPPLRR